MRPFITFTLLVLFFHTTAKIVASEPHPAVKLHYLGHCSFILQFDDTLSVITDYAQSYPYYSQEYNSPIYKIYGGFVPDIATYSHQHTDHYAPGRLPEGVSTILEESDTFLIKDLLIKPVRTSESNTTTLDNSTFFFYYKGLTFVHSGDLDANMKAIDNVSQQNHLRELFPDTVDVLMLVIQSTENLIAYAEKFIDFLKPRIVIPMHYWTPGYQADFIDYLLDENVLHGKSYSVEYTDSADYSIYFHDSLQQPTRVVCLRPMPFGDTNSSAGDLAYGKKTYASSIMDSNHRPEQTTDGYADTRWQSSWGATSAELVIDLGEEKLVNGIILKWLYWVKSFEIQLSTDSADWNTVLSVSDHANILLDSAVFDQSTAKFIRIRMIQSGSATGFGLYSAGVYEDLAVHTPSDPIVYNTGMAEIRCFPSPATDQITFEIESAVVGKALLRLSDTSGREALIRTEEIQVPGKYVFSIDVSPLAEGLYNYTLSSDNVFESGSIVIMHH